MSRQELSAMVGPEPAEQVALERRIQCVIGKLGSICKAATFDFALAVGRLVIDEFYDGDMNRWRNRDPGKEISLRKLARHPQLPMNPSALYRSVAIYELSERLDLRSWKYISTSHMRLVLPLSPDEQARLLLAAETNAWSVRRLDQEVSTLRSTSLASRGGRKRRSHLSGVMHSVRKCFEGVGELLNATDDDILHGSPESARAALDLLRGAADACDALRARLTSALPEAQGESDRADEERYAPSGLHKCVAASADDPLPDPSASAASDDDSNP